MMSKTMRVRALLLLLCLLAGLLLSACARTEEENAAPSVILSKNGEITCSFRPSEEHLGAYGGEAILLYEIKLGETVADALGRDPIAKGKLRADTSLKFPLGERERIYSSFLPVAQDGTHLTDAPMILSDPSVLASISVEFPNSNRIKGLVAADAELSRLLYSAHTLVSLSASALTSGDGAVIATLANVGVALDSAQLARADREVLAATNAGMQVSLSLLPDADLPLPAYAAILDLLAERYVGGECGFVSAILIGKTQERTAQNELEVLIDASRHAQLLRYAETALLSRYANGLVYLTVGGELSSVEAYLSEVKTLTDAMGCTFGVALSPDCALPQEEPTEDDLPRLSLFSLDGAVKTLRSALGRYTRFAVVDLSFPATDPSLQAALSTYAYRASMNVKADMMIYSSLAGDSHGLYTADLTERPAARAFRLADTDENTEGERLAASLLSDEWKQLKSARTARFSFVGVANSGATEDRGSRLFDFNGENAPVFSVAGSGQAPTTLRSESLGARVLAASLNQSNYPLGSGLRCTLAEPSALKNAYVLSTRILPQAAPAFPAENATVTLLLDGTSANGQAISYSASVSVACGAWQDLTFQIRDFTERMDASKPCTLTLLMQPDYQNGSIEDASGAAADGDPDGTENAEEDSLPHFALWIHSFNVREAAPDNTLPIAISIAVLCFAVAACAVLLLRRLFAKRRA